MTILVTGGAGFIGSNFVLRWFDRSEEQVVNLDRLTYAGNLDNLESLDGTAGHVFVRGDISDAACVDALLASHRPRAIVNFAAESHVDRSIHGPEDFVQTNVVGTFRLLEAARGYFNALGEADRAAFRFLHVSTDEVFGSLGPTGLFTEESQYRPNSPYSASKAGADHVARAYFHTYGVPVVTTNCSNNYGPYQFPEKLIPLVTLNAVEGKSLPVYGNGQNIRDWLWVKDHCAALLVAAERGRPGETYNIGGRSERTNLEVVETICAILDEIHPKASKHRDQITFVKDRPGHDLRYAIDATKLEQELGWRAQETFDTGIEKTVRWYLDNEWWWRPLRDKVYAGERLGVLSEPEPATGGQS